MRKWSDWVDKLFNILTNVITGIIAVLLVAISIGLFLIAAGLVWNGVLSIWSMIL